MNIIDLLRLDIEDIEKEYTQIAAALGNIGLSNYESRIYVALILKSHGTAEDIAELAMIPRTSAYKALLSLREKKFVEETGGRPTIYHPVPLEEIRARAMNDLNGIFNKLNTVKGLLSERGTPELVYTIHGKKKVLSKIGELLESSKKTFVISSPKMHDIRNELSNRFKDAVKRGVRVTIITVPSIKVPEATEVFRRKSLIATDVISDSTRAMIASDELDLCGFSDNPLLAAHLENFLYMVKEEN
ncbi:MAG TPA: helix-turn-helix domain-containing protein [Methanomassiliicoccales archaeon]|nr:helix-turn-helix domain-containing protein [Methanomassiliicoccales archaeon]